MYPSNPDWPAAHEAARFNIYLPCTIPANRGVRPSQENDDVCRSVGRWPTSSHWGRRRLSHNWLSNTAPKSWRCARIYCCGLRARVRACVRACLRHESGPKFALSLVVGARRTVMRCGGARCLCKLTRLHPRQGWPKSRSQTRHTKTRAMLSMVGATAARLCHPESAHDPVRNVHTHLDARAMPLGPDC